MQEDESKLLPVILEQSSLVEIEIPRMIADCGAAAHFSWEEWLFGSIRNHHTRKAYLHAVRRFLEWAERHDITLKQVTPGIVGRYFEQHPGSIPTKKLHMAGIRKLFDALVLRHVIFLNPAHSVKLERYSVTEGKTPEITVEQARTLKNSIPLTSVIDYRDRAIISMLIYTAARVGAVSKLDVSDLVEEGNQTIIRFHEKRGKQRTIPVRSNLQEDLSHYLTVSGMLAAEKGIPLFPSAFGRTRELGPNRMSPIDIARMIKKRLNQADLPNTLSGHSLRACAATDLLRNGTPMEDVQQLLGHSDSRTTRLYDRRKRYIARSIVEKISV